MTTVPVILSDDELAFLRLICVVFPAAESPLRYLEEEGKEPDDVEQAFGALKERQLLESDVVASPALLARLLPVVECDARIRMVAHKGVDEERRDYYVQSQRVVEYRRAAGEHRFGIPQSEVELAAGLAAAFKLKREVNGTPLRLTSGDYLVFALFARDVRDSETPTGPDAPMSLDEVLSYFDEPETKYVRTPSDDSWQQSLATLAGQGVLVKKGDGYELHPSYHALARELVADNQHTLSRYDYLDEHWLVREVNLYPTQDSLYRIGTEPDGAVVIQEMSPDELLRIIGGVVGTLPTLLPSEGTASKKTLVPARG